MKIESDRYIELTEKELTSLYLENGFENIMSLVEYRIAMENSGCKIVEE